MILLWRSFVYYKMDPKFFYLHEMLGVSTNSLEVEVAAELYSSNSCSSIEVVVVAVLVLVIILIVVVVIVVVAE